MDLSFNENAFDASIVQYFEGGIQQIQLSRSRIFTHPSNEDSLLVCAGDECSGGALIWDFSSNNRMQTIKSETPVLDISLIQSNSNKYFLTALTDKTLKVYKSVV